MITIRIKKGRDGSVAFTCTRPDGTATWQRQEGPKARFFPRHDLTHYAVETELGHRRGFYGLVADGWDLADFGTPWPRGPIPPDADPAEVIVGFLDGERAGGVTWTAAALNDRLAAYFAQQGTSAHAAPITEAQLARIRDRMRALFDAWDAVPPGESLALTFEPPAAPRPA